VPQDVRWGPADKAFQAMVLVLGIIGYKLFADILLYIYVHVDTWHCND
jgi:hypothetical protein